MKVAIKVFLLTILFGSIATNFFLFNASQHKQMPGVTIQRSSKYPLLAEEALDDTYTSDLINNFLPLRQQLHQITDSYKNSVAFYFQYLPTGTSIGINEDDEFTAASLLKVPVVMAYFHKKERLGIKLDPTVTIQPNELNSSFGDLYKQGAGSSLNLGDAVKAAIQQSDNTASFVLADQISNDDFMYVYEGLDIDPATEQTNPIITAQQYSSILKSLYFGGILTNDDSQYILNLMTHTDFHDMLPSGVPDNVRVAHKIGLIDKQIYSDCGIVYVPNRPYLLCMISKSDHNTAEERMHDISKAIYDYVAGYKVN